MRLEASLAALHGTVQTLNQRQFQLFSEFCESNLARISYAQPSDTLEAVGREDFGVASLLEGAAEKRRRSSFEIAALNFAKRQRSGLGTGLDIDLLVVEDTVRRIAVGIVLDIARRRPLAVQLALLCDKRSLLLLERLHSQEELLHTMAHSVACD